MSATHQEPHFNRELSWLRFNERVLQEAEDPTVPLFERLTFLAIFSSNLDEFFRVRVASLRSLLRLKKKTLDKLDIHPAELLRQIHATVARQQQHFGEIFRLRILPELESHGIRIVDEHTASSATRHYAESVFETKVRPLLHPANLAGSPESAPFLANRKLYLVTELWAPDEKPLVVGSAPEYVLIEIPEEHGRFLVFQDPESGQKEVLFVDDVIRMNLPGLFPRHEVGGAFSVKLTRDADLNLDDEFSGDLVLKIKESLARRSQGVPSRFLYDEHIPHPMLEYLRGRLKLEADDLVAGGKYHNFSDFFGFPRTGPATLSNEPFEPLPHPDLKTAPSLRRAVERQDHLLHVPYQQFDYVIRFLEEAASDPETEEIRITLYRVARDSRVVGALIDAARCGVRVTAFVEVKARFDEESNLYWAEQMEQAGVRVLYSLPGLKVHSKAALVLYRSPEGPRKRTAYLGTGNFNEKTARIYADLGLFTADPRLTEDLERFFDYLSDLSEGQTDPPAFANLLVAPAGLRRALNRRIDREIAHARAGREARITLKMNALEDRKMIRRLYKASRAGVQIRLIVRGVCCLVPGVPEWSETIEARSIIDRFLEHARVFHFHNGGEDELYLASADWMQRNLSERIEIAFPVYDDRLRGEIFDFVERQWSDNRKARRIDAGQTNAYVADDSACPVRAQADQYAWYLEQLNASPEDGGHTALLNALPLFDQMDEQLRSALAGLFAPAPVRAGERIETNGPEKAGLYVVASGCFEEYGSASGPRRFERGDHFGELSLFDPAFRVAPVRAVRDGVLLFLSGRRLMERLSPEETGVVARWLASHAAETLRLPVLTATEALVAGGAQDGVAFVPALPPSGASEEHATRAEAALRGALEEAGDRSLVIIVGVDGDSVGLDADGPEGEERVMATWQSLVDRLPPALAGRITNVVLEPVGDSRVLRVECRSTLPPP